MLAVLVHFAVAVVLTAFVAWLVALAYLLIYLALLLRERPGAFTVDAIYLTNEWSGVFPSSYDYGYNEPHSLARGFAVEWLWINVSFRRLPR